MTVAQDPRTEPLRVRLQQLDSQMRRVWGVAPTRLEGHKQTNKEVNVGKTVNEFIGRLFKFVSGRQ